MAMSKLNVFQWHVTNAKSFPMVLHSHPELSQTGAFSQSQVYYPSDIREIVEYGRVRGVRILPSFDSPGHVAEGFQLTNLITCYNSQPWEMYCSDPPCGQLDSTKEELYALLHDVFSEIHEIFDNPPQFDIGGYRVYPACWNSSEEVRNWMTDRGWELTEDGYLKLLDLHRARALAIYRNITSENNKPILWSNMLESEDFIDEHLDPDDYVIQVAHHKSQIPYLLGKGYDIIISNNDVLTLDCGFGSYRDNASYWCSSYIPWYSVYDNDIRSMVGNGGNRISQVLGGTVCAWSMPFDEVSLDRILWPRASAHGERMWSDPNTNYRDAEFRILLHREFLVQYGIDAESIQPEWCIRNLGDCRVNS